MLAQTVGAILTREQHATTNYFRATTSVARNTEKYLHSGAHYISSIRPPPTSPLYLLLHFVAKRYIKSFIIEDRCSCFLRQLPRLRIFPARSEERLIWYWRNEISVQLAKLPARTNAGN